MALTAGQPFEDDLDPITKIRITARTYLGDTGAIFGIEYNNTTTGQFEAIEHPTNAQGYWHIPLNVHPTMEWGINVTIDRDSTTLSGHAHPTGLPPWKDDQTPPIPEEHVADPGDQFPRAAPGRRTSD